MHGSGQQRTQPKPFVSVIGGRAAAEALALVVAATSPLVDNRLALIARAKSASCKSSSAANSVGCLRGRAERRSEEEEEAEDDDDINGSKSSHG